MNLDQLNDTKRKILNVANKLFGLQGFHATSVREIAKEADVNVAAINYHFTNKENLYCELFEYGYETMSQMIHELEQKNDYDSREFTWQVYQLFLNNQFMLLNTFKMFLMPNMLLDKEIACLSHPSENGGGDFGPPGQDAFMSVITKDVGEDIPFKARHWAIRMIFSNIVHFAVAMSSPLMQMKADQVEYLSPEEKKKSTYHLVEAMLDYIKKNPEKWK